MHAKCTTRILAWLLAAWLLPVITLRAPALQMGRRKCREAESHFKVTNLLNQVCLSLSDITDLGGKGEEQRRREERKKGREAGRRKEERKEREWQGRIRETGLKIEKIPLSVPQGHVFVTLQFCDLK